VAESLKTPACDQPWEVQMASFKHPRVFDPLDLEIIDRVCEAAWAQLEACEPFRDREQDEERREALCKLVMDQTGTDRSLLC
jgi:hypothetical protein